MSNWKPGKHIATCACTPCRRHYAETIIQATCNFLPVIYGDNYPLTKRDIDTIINAANKELETP